MKTEPVRCTVYVHSVSLSISKNTDMIHITTINSKMIESSWKREWHSLALSLHFIWALCEFWEISLLLHTGLEEKRYVNVRDRTRAKGNQTNDEHTDQSDRHGDQAASVTYSVEIYTWCVFMSYGTAFSNNCIWRVIAVEIGFIRDH